MTIRTDLELAAHFSAAIGDSYREGVEFASALPDHALVRFRDALEFMCLDLAGRHDIVFGQGSLRDKIDLLLERGVITFAVKDQFHRIRMLCNPGAHRSSAAGDQEEKEAFAAHREQLLANARAVRDQLATVLLMIYQSETGAAIAPGITKPVVATQEWKDLLFSASSAANPEAKYKAGLWCESEADRMLCSVTDLIVSNDFDRQHRFLTRMAASFYEAAHAINPTRNIDAMFRYATLVEQGYLDGDKRDEAVQMIRQAASAGHAAACDHYAAILCTDDENYTEAERYWQLAIQKGVTRAYYCLWQLYSDAKYGMVNKPLSMEYLQRGVDEEDPDCLVALGICYWEGDGIGKDEAKGRALLEQAAKLGHGRARAYLILEVNGGAKIAAAKMQMMAAALGAYLPKAAPAGNGKIGVNEPCPCGSGKKYKRCCRLLQQ